MKQIARISDYHFAPTENSKLNLLKENIAIENVLVTGNTVIDALIGSVEHVENYDSKFVNSLRSEIDGREVILVTEEKIMEKVFIRICMTLLKNWLRKIEIS